jgi:hypothetical protein
VEAIAYDTEASGGLSGEGHEQYRRCNSTRMKEDEAMRTRCRTWGFLIIACLSVLSVLGGRTAVAAERTLTIRDTIGRDWAEEPITWSVEFTANGPARPRARAKPSCRP